eukprot:TRINITY_DN19548_c0_g1_i1.p1 TRINITY_DN19548_c0_g1~~TRINITY_DN19548_c0_g1_i1.p1  ORF type:complete len:169 (+),score=13.21 TRINITY_DN19548_c0_g1_i1:75-581(+)
MTKSILSQFSNQRPKHISKVIVNAVTSNQINSATNALIQFITQPNGPSTVTSILSIIMKSTSVTPQQLTIIIKSLQSSSAPNATLIVEDALRQNIRDTDVSQNIVQMVYDAIFTTDLLITSPVNSIIKSEGCDKAKPLLDAIKNLAQNNNQYVSLYTFTVTNDQFREC